jgi:hypothetical protein
MTLPSVPPLTGLARVLAIPVGLVVCFYGYRILKVTMGIAGFFVGASTCVSLATAAHWGPGLVIGAGIVGGLIAAWLAVALYFLGIFVLGFAAFFSLAQLLVHSLPAAIGIAILGGIVTVILQKFMLMVTTAFGGASIVVSSVLALIHGRTVLRIDDLWQPLRGGAGTGESLLVLAAALILGAAGLFAQMGLARRRRDRGD